MTGDPTIDRVIEGVLVRVVTGALGAVVPRAWRKGRDLVQKPQDASDAPATSNTETGPLPNDAGPSSPPHLSEPSLASRVHDALQLPETDAIARQICAALLTGDNRHANLASVRAEFDGLISLHLPPDDAKRISAPLFEALVTGCEQAVATLAASRGAAPSLPEMGRSTPQYRQIVDELAAVNRTLELLASEHRPNIAAITEFENRYRTQIASRHGFITPPTFDTTRKIPIDELYVPSDLVTVPRRRAERPERLELPQFLSTLYRGVVLGSPGGGKSTLANKVCHDLAVHYSKRLLAGRKVTPILVVLRDYGAAKKEKGQSIVQFIEHTSNSNYQIPAPTGAIAYLLAVGRVLVIFDGLDELLDTNYRQEIGADVENFCTLYPNVPILVTSREVGYEQAPLDERRFEIFRLAPFSDSQVRDYARKWFALDPDLTGAEQTSRTQAFVTESQFVPDLRANPLMLSLMCSIYRGEGYIPRNRPDVYEKCATMLFERWDKGRGILVPLPFEQDLGPAMRYLAFWIYSDESLQGGVTEARLVAEASGYLLGRRFEYTEDAERAAREFIQFCRGRAWVFTDTGTTREGERLYQFTHRTFLEFFTADHLVRTHPTPDALAQGLRPRVERREWDVVAQLAFQLQHRRVDGAGDALILDLLRHAQTGSARSASNLLSFAARSLQYIIPRPIVARQVAAAALEHQLAGATADQVRTTQTVIQNGASVFVRHRLDLPVESLPGVAGENRQIVLDAVRTFVVRQLDEGSAEHQRRALEMGIYFDLNAHYMGAVYGGFGDSGAFASRIVECVLDTVGQVLVDRSGGDFDSAYDAVMAGRLSIARFASLRGLGELFRLRKLAAFVDTQWLPSIVENCIISVGGALKFVFFPGTARPVDAVRHLAEIGSVLLASARPWLDRGQLAARLVRPWMLSERFDLRADDWSAGEGAGVSALDADALFGAVLVLAVLLEGSSNSSRRDLLTHIERGRIPLLGAYRATLLARYRVDRRPEAFGELEAGALGAEQRALLRDWIVRRVHFVRQRRRAAVE